MRGARALPAADEQPPLLHPSTMASGSAGDAAVAPMLKIAAKIPLDVLL